MFCAFSSRPLFENRTLSWWATGVCTARSSHGAQKRCEGGEFLCRGAPDPDTGILQVILVPHPKLGGFINRLYRPFISCQYFIDVKINVPEETFLTKSI